MLSKKKKTKIIRCTLAISATAVFVLIVSLILVMCGKTGEISNNNPDDGKAKLIPRLNFEVDLLDISKYSRPGIPLKQVNGVVVHYTANPGTDAKDNRNYFNNLEANNKANGTNRFASAHFVIGLEGNIVQCIPLAEMAYASNGRNTDTVAIECCHPKEDGKFTKATYDALLETLTYLCIRFDLDPKKDVIRHYDVTGKLCPKYYVEKPDKWEELLADLEKRVQITKEGLDNGSIEADTTEKPKNEKQDEAEKKEDKSDKNE